MAKEEVLRARAVSMYTQGQSVSDIAKALGRSRQWVHKWINRSQCDSADWSQSLSTAPHYVPNKVSLSMEEQVISARQQLLASPYHEAGAYAILHQLQGKGITPPSVATINRILKRNGLVTKKVRRSKSGLDYPEEPIDMHVMDLIGPRYLHGGGRFYMLTIISNDTRHAGVYPIPSKSGENITQSVIRFWQSYSLPCFLKLDNELSFRGSNRHPPRAIYRVQHLTFYWTIYNLTILTEKKTPTRSRGGERNNGIRLASKLLPIAKKDLHMSKKSSTFVADLE